MGVLEVILACLKAFRRVVAHHGITIGIAESAFGDGTIHLERVDEVDSISRSNEQVVEIAGKRLVRKQLLIVCQVMQRIIWSDEPLVRLKVAVEIFFAVFRPVDVEAIRHKNPCVHHEVAVFHRLDGFVRVEPHLEFQGELVVDFCREFDHSALFLYCSSRLKPSGCLAFTSL